LVDKIIRGPSTYPSPHYIPKLIGTEEPTKTHKRRERREGEPNITNTNKNLDLEP
jgi:hypothetical protein